VSVYVGKKEKEVIMGKHNRKLLMLKKKNPFAERKEIRAAKGLRGTTSCM